MVRRLTQVMFQYIVSKSKLFLTGLIMFITSLLTLQPGYCQDEINRYDNLLNPWVTNPAFTGSRANSFNFYANKQWFGFKGAPSFFGFHINGRLAPYDFYSNRMQLNKTRYKSLGRVGLGAALVTDRNGPFIYSGLKLNYSYHIQFNKNQLSFGLANDFDLFSIDENEMDPLVPNDPGIQDVKHSKIIYNPGLGVSYYNSTFEIGASINNIFKKDVILKHDYMEYPDNQTIFSLQGSYILYPDMDFSFESRLWLSTHEFSDILYDISEGIIYKEDYKFSLTYRSLGCFVVHVGMVIGRYNFVYGFSSPTGGLGKYIYGSHEILIGMRFGSYVY